MSTAAHRANRYRSAESTGAAIEPPLAFCARRGAPGLSESAIMRGLRRSTDEYPTAALPSRFRGRGLRRDQRPGRAPGRGRLCQGQAEQCPCRIHLPGARRRRAPDAGPAFQPADLPAPVGPRRLPAAAGDRSHQRAAAGPGQLPGMRQPVAGGLRYQRRQGAVELLQEVRGAAAQGAGEGRAAGGGREQAASAADLQERPRGVSRHGRGR